MKICTLCKKSKPLTEYRRHHISRDGLTYRCKSCLQAKDEAHYAANRERIIARVTSYQGRTQPRRHVRTSKPKAAETIRGSLFESIRRRASVRN